MLIHGQVEGIIHGIMEGTIRGKLRRKGIMCQIGDMVGRVMEEVTSAQDICMQVTVGKLGNQIKIKETGEEGRGRIIPILYQCMVTHLWLHSDGTPCVIVVQ